MEKNPQFPIQLYSKVYTTSRSWPSKLCESNFPYLLDMHILGNHCVSFKERNTIRDAYQQDITSHSWESFMESF